MCKSSVNLSNGIEQNSAAASAHDKICLSTELINGVIVEMLCCHKLNVIIAALKNT